MQRLLVIQTAFIGDAILATAVLEKLHRFYPEAQLDLLVRKGNEGIFRGHPFLHRLLVWDKGRKYRDLWRIWREIRATRYDAVVNLQRFGATGFLTAMSGAVQRIGFDKNPFAWGFTHRLPHRFGTAEQPIHEVERSLSLVAHLTDASFERPRLYPSADDYARVRYEGEYVCLAPASVWATKQWPPERWADLLRHLPANQTAFLLGGKGDAELCAAIIEQSGNSRAVNRAGQLDLLQSAALMQGAAMNYVNDSAPLHLASAMNAPVTAFFCSTVPEFGFTPLSDISIIRQTPESLACRPCGLHGKKKCPEGHFRCGAY